MGSRSPLHGEPANPGSPFSAFALAGVTVRLASDLPAGAYTFAPALEAFRIGSPGDDGVTDAVTIHHHFSIPDIGPESLGQEVYNHSPWTVYKQENGWLYLGIFPPGHTPGVHTVALFNPAHTRAEIWVWSEEIVRSGLTHALTLFPTDQILLARALADRQAGYFHAAGMVVEGKGLMFVGHSTAGKSTTVKMLREEGQILCDDRVVVRRWPDGFRVHGTWSHGEIPEVSPGSAPLNAILLLEKSTTNALSPALTPKEVVQTLPQYVVRPLVTADWWDKILTLVGHIAREVPVYRLQLDKSGKVREVLKGL